MLRKRAAGCNTSPVETRDPVPPQAGDGRGDQRSCGSFATLTTTASTRGGGGGVGGGGGGGVGGGGVGGGGVGGVEKMGHSATIIRTKGYFPESAFPTHVPMQKWKDGTQSASIDKPHFLSQSITPNP